MKSDEFLAKVRNRREYASQWEAAHLTRITWRGCVCPDRRDRNH